MNTRHQSDTHQYRILGIVERPQMADASAEVMTMGERGEMLVELLRAEPVRTRNEIVSNNMIEYERCFRSREVWEARLQNSPLDTKLQDFVAYHQDVVRRFEQWFFDQKIAIPSVSDSRGPMNGVNRAGRNDIA